MAKPKTDWSAIFTGMIATVGSLGVAALVVDWAKAAGYWPGMKSPKLTAEGEDYVGGDETDPVLRAARRL